MAFEDFKILNYNNSQVSPELFARHQSRLFTGNVIDGLTLVPKTGLTVTLQPGNGMVAYGTGATASARLLSLVADFDITLSTADASNPRIDSIVCYVDSVTLGSPTPDGQGVWKAVKVNGTPNASPVAPDNTAIQAVIGAGKPYFVTHDVRVDATVTTIAFNKITDRRVWARLGTLNIANNAVTKEKIDFSTFEIAAASGVVTTTTSGPFVSAGISVSVTVGTRVKVHISGGMYNSVSGNDTRLGFALSGANTLAANISRAIQTSASTGWVIGRTIVLTGLTPGVTTFTLMKSVSAGTGTYFADPAIIVEPY